MAGEEQKQAAIFFTLIAFVIIALLVFWFTGLLGTLAILIVILVVLLGVYSQIGTFFVQLAEYERAVVFRMGKFKKLIGPGWFFLIPFLEYYRKVDLRVKTMDIAAQEVLTRDNIKLTFDAIIYTKVVDPKAAIINVENYEKASASVIQAALRDVVGKTNMSDVISNVDQLNSSLHKALRETARSWGVAVEKCEVQNIQLPKEVLAAMHGRKEAEQRKFASIETAEGRKISITALEAAAGKLTNPTLQYFYLQALEKIAEGKSTKFIFPMELSRLAAGLSAKLGLPYEQAQEKVVREYQEKVK